MTVELSRVPKSRRENSFFETSRTLRFLLLLCAAVVLFFFIHVQEVHLPTLELGATAPRYIVAQVPFTFIDEEATVMAQQATMAEIGRIYQIGSDEVFKRQREFESFLVLNRSWRTTFPDVSFDEMCQVFERMKTALLGVRLSDSRTLQRMRQGELDTSDFCEIVPVDLKQGICLTEKVWNFVRNKAFPDPSFPPEETDFVVSFLREKIWFPKSDPAAAKLVRRALRQKVTPVVVSVAPGSRIIGTGEKVTPRHVAMLRAMKQSLDQQRNLWDLRTIAGSVIMTGLILTVAILFFRRYHPDILASNTRIFLILVLVILGLSLAKLCELVQLHRLQGSVDLLHYPLLTPLVALLLCILVNSSVAIFLSALLSMLFDLCLSFDSQGFLLANFLVSLVMIFLSKSLRRRAEIVGICFRGWLTACAVILSLYCYVPSPWAEMWVGDAVGAGVFMLMTAIIALGLLPLLEAGFRVLTDINLMEYMNPHNELLRRLMVEAPGTYQHSLLLGSVSEAAAQAIGCNGLFCRVATLYHDIGKLSTSQYFTENQQTGMNIHQLLTPAESAKVIISHVEEGVALARRASLPEQFIDIIREHHGTSLVYFFYHKQLEAVGHDPSQVDDRDFRYAGPKPHSKEAAIIMIADSFEAACRSLEEINEEVLTRLIDQIVREKIEDGQFDECILNFEELKTVKRAMVRCLMSIGHFRIKYPTKGKPAAV